MIEFHYNIPEGKLDSIINSIALYLTPDTGTREGRIAESILKKPREALLDERRIVRAAKMGWQIASSAACAISAYPCNDLSRKELMELTAIRYMPPARTINDYYISIYGRQAAGMGDYPLTLGVKDNDSMAYNGDAELRSFAEMAKDMGFKEATEMLYTLKDKRLYRNKFEPPISEDFLNKKIKQDEQITYDSRFIAEIQMIRFYWDFFGLAIKKAGYMPEKVNGNSFSFMQPWVEKEIEGIAGFPTKNAWDVASGMIKEALLPDTAIMQKALEIKKRILMND